MLVGRGHRQGDLHPNSIPMHVCWLGHQGFKDLTPPNRIGCCWTDRHRIRPGGWSATTFAGIEDLHVVVELTHFTSSATHGTRRAVHWTELPRCAGIDGMIPP